LPEAAAESLIRSLREKKNESGEANCYEVARISPDTAIHILSDVARSILGDRITVVVGDFDQPVVAALFPQI